MSCFKAYDIRGRVPGELDACIAYRLGLAYAERFTPDRVALGHDVRHSSRGLLEALALGLEHGGARAVDLGLCGTEEVYFAAMQPDIDGGMMITASHNPAEYNGMKLVRDGAVPVSGDSGLRELEQAVLALRAQPHGAPELEPAALRAHYLEHLLSYIAGRALAPLRIVVNSGNGCAGPVIDALAPRLPIELVHIQTEPDGDFPHGVPNPLLPENRRHTADAVRQHRADFGVAFDGDFDRCFLFDEQGRFIESYYLVGLLAESLLQESPGQRIVHDPRLTWNTIELVAAAGGTPVQCKTGHAFIKERMRSEDALYGGEMSGHHYFRRFGYCDSGMIPWLLVAAIVSERGTPLSVLLDERLQRFPVSGEINRRVDDAQQVMGGIRMHYAADALKLEHIDGLSAEFADWRFNLRRSNTEPMLRLNVETRADTALLQARTRELLAMIDSGAPL